MNARKLAYSRIILPDAEWRYSYSASELQTELNDLFFEHPLRAIYIDLFGYVNAQGVGRNWIDLSYLGGSSLVIGGSMVLQLLIHGTGMTEYRVFPAWECRIIKKSVGVLPDDISENKYFFSLSDHNTSFGYEGNLIRRVDVIGTRGWAYYSKSFDESAAKAAAVKNDLPTEISLVTDTSTIHFHGEDIEYYPVSIEKTP